MLGPKKHYKKNGTPTMGGVVFIVSISLTYLFFLFINNSLSIEYLMLLFPFLFYGLIGFVDDYIKVIKQNNNGLSVKKKFILQLIFAVLFVIFFNNWLETTVNIFGYKVDFGLFYYVFIILMFLGTTNATNLSDGLDGLVSGEILIILGSTLFICNAFYLQVLNIIVIGAVLGFFCYNVYPAKIFMGDVGSLSLGAYLCTFFIALKLEILLIVFCFVMVFETISVILQVSYFKISKGKRIFKMTPFHHHLELLGLEEFEVSIILWCITLIFSLFGILFYNYLF